MAVAAEVKAKGVISMFAILPVCEAKQGVSNSSVWDTQRQQQHQCTFRAPLEQCGMPQVFTVQDWSAITCNVCMLEGIDCARPCELSIWLQDLMWQHKGRCLVRD